MVHNDQEQVPPISGLHHLKFVVRDLTTSLDWYKKVLGAVHLEQLDHYDSVGKRYAVLLKLESLGNTLLELRENDNLAKLHQKFDPVTFAVEGKADLASWSKWLDVHHVKHSPVLTGVIGWLLVFEDPDLRFLRLYTEETHDKTDDPDADAYWL